MGVIYKLKDEVVHFIVSQRQQNPLFSCRQLAESASQKFGLNLSKSSVHDVLKQSGIVSQRGRKPKNKFVIPHEKKKQIQDNLSQVNLPVSIAPPAAMPAPSEVLRPTVQDIPKDEELKPVGQTAQISPIYNGAGQIFFKAAAWDLGIYSTESVKEKDWPYYLTYVKGIKVFLKNGKDFFIDLPVPIERCIQETVDCLIANISPLIVAKVSNEDLFNACMNNEDGAGIGKVAVVDNNDLIISEFKDIVECKRQFLVSERVFVETNEIDLKKRMETLFFSETIGNNGFIDAIVNCKGFDSVSDNVNTVTLIIPEAYKNSAGSEAEKLNKMYLRDKKNRLVAVKLQMED